MRRGKARTRQLKIGAFLLDQFGPFVTFSVASQRSKTCSKEITKMEFAAFQQEFAIIVYQATHLQLVAKGPEGMNSVSAYRLAALV